MLPVILPLTAFALPVMVICRNAKRPVRRPYRYSLASFAAALGALCQEVWVFGENISAGMSQEIDQAERHNMTIRYFSSQCTEV